MAPGKKKKAVSKRQEGKKGAGSKPKEHQQDSEVQVRQSFSLGPYAAGNITLKGHTIAQLHVQQVS